MEGLVGGEQCARKACTGRLVKSLHAHRTPPSSSAKKSAALVRTPEREEPRCVA